MKMHLAESKKSWSIFDPRPVMYYNEDVDAYLVYWNGLVMTHSLALTIAGSYFLGVWPTPKMKEHMFSEFKRLYYSGAFGETQWDIEKFHNETHFSYIGKKLSDHMNDKLKAHYQDKPAEVLSWFDKRLAHD